jgi:hypothetical protein
MGFIEMLDRKSEKWVLAPFWVKIGLWGIKSRRTALAFEVFCAAFATAALVGALLNPSAVIGSILFAAAYWYAVSIRWADRRGLWAETA